MVSTTAQKALETFQRRKRSYQRQTQVLNLAVSRMIALVPKPSAVRKDDLRLPDVLLEARFGL